MPDENKPAPAAPVKSWRNILPIHPAADLFPLMSPDELRALGKDIRENGLASPIVLWRANLDSPAVLLDGRNRLDAMEAVGLQTVWKDGTIDWEAIGHDPNDPVILSGEGDDPVDPYAFVLSANVHRRHLTPELRDKLIADVIKANPNKSNRAIGEMVKADKNKVKAVRTELESTGEVAPVEKTIGKDGKARKQPAKRRRTEDDFKRDIAAKRAATSATAMPGDIGPMLPPAGAVGHMTKKAPPPPNDDVGDVALALVADEQARIAVTCLADVRVCIKRAFDALDAEHWPILRGGLRQVFSEIRGWNRAAATSSAVPIAPPADDGLDIPPYLDRRPAP